MASKSPVLEDGSWLSHADRVLYRVERVFALITGLAILSLMVLAVVSVTGRHVFNQPLPGYVDWIEQAMPLIAFMGISYTQRDGAHIRMDILIGRLRGRVLWATEALGVLLMLLLMVLLVWGTWEHFLRSFDFAMPLWSRDSTIDIALPIWPAKLVVPIAFGVLVLRLCVQLIGYCRAFLYNQEHPVAVPLIESAETIARKEAESLSGEL